MINECYKPVTSKNKIEITVISNDNNIIEFYVLTL